MQKGGGVMQGGENSDFLTPAVLNRTRGERLVTCEATAISEPAPHKVRYA